MRILLINDDGIFSEGLLTAAKWAQTLGEVTVSAPKREQSGKSHGIEIHAPYEIKKVDLLPGAECYAVDSTPADCVRWATVGLNRTYDLVISGVNRGFNIGEDIVYSATCGGIFEAAYYKIPAMAVSTDPKTFDAAREHLGRVYDFIRGHEFFTHSGLFNVNIPLSPRGIRVTRQGGPYFKDRFLPLGGDMYQADGYPVYENTGDLSLDTDAVMNGYISITPLTVARTDFATYEKLSRFDQ